MSTLPTVVLTVLAVLLVAIALRDVFDTLVPAPVRLRATMLRDAIGDFARTTAARFHKSPAEDTDEVLEDYGRDHLLDRSTGDATARSRA
jgi:hypothetical protein